MRSIIRYLNEGIFNNLFNSDSKFVYEVRTEDSKKYKNELTRFLKEQNVGTNNPDDAVGASMLLYHNHVVGLWEHQYSPRHNYFENYFDKCTPDLGKALPTMVKEIRRIIDNTDYPCEIFVPKKDYDRIKKDVSLIEGVKLEKVSRYEKNYTIEIHPI